MKKHAFVSRRMVGFFRAGYSADAPRTGYVALLALCGPTAGAAAGDHKNCRDGSSAS